MPDRQVRSDTELREVSGECNQNGPELIGENRSSGLDQDIYATRTYPPSHGAVKTRIDVLTVD